MAKIEVKNLTAKYEKGKNVLENLSFTVEDGEILCLIGPNGGGKSTLLTLLAGIGMGKIKKTKNSEILINQKKIESYAANKKAREISYLGQTEKLAWHFSVFETVLMGRYAHSSAYLPYSKEDKQIALSVLEDLGIFHLKDRLTNEISGGELQKVRIARSLCQNTDIMLLDEPFSHLDIQHQSKLLSLIKTIAEEKKKTIVISLHDLNLCPLLSKTILLVNKTEAFFGSLEEIFTESYLNKVYKTDFGLFRHPELDIPQVFVKN